MQDNGMIKRLLRDVKMSRLDGMFKPSLRTLNMQDKMECLNHH